MPVEGVFGKPGVGVGSGLSVAGVFGLTVEFGAVAQVLGLVGFVQADAGQAERIEGGEFFGLADAVLVVVAPQAQLVPAGVLGVDGAVGIGVQFGQGGVAVGGLLSGGEQRMVAEEFASGVDGAVAVAVAVEDENAVIALEPGGACPDAVAVVVEEGGLNSVPGRCQLGNLYPVSVKVKHQRRRLHGGAGREVLGGLPSPVIPSFAHPFLGGKILFPLEST